MELTVRANWWKDELAKRDHFISNETATILDVWENEGFPLILEGPPGGGKTTLAEKAAEVLNATYFNLQCNKFLTNTEILYSWNTNLQKVLIDLYIKEHNEAPKNPEELMYCERTLLKGKLVAILTEANDKVVFCLDEFDKFEPGSGLENLFLEFLAKFEITIEEINTKYSRNSKPNPRVVITSNAGRYGDRDSLSNPILGRALYHYIPPPNDEQLYAILKRAAPLLPSGVLIDCVLFNKWAGQVFRWDKPFTIREMLMWVKSLQRINNEKPISSLTEEMAKHTSFCLVKTPDDGNRLLEYMARIFIDINANKSEILFWNKIKNSRNINDFETYLEKFAGGMFNELAKKNINRLEFEYAKMKSKKLENINLSENLETHPKDTQSMEQKLLHIA